MDLSKYFNNAHEDLKPLGCEPEFQLLKVYAFNAYFGADPVKVRDVNEGCTYRRDKYAGIDGVFVNESLDEPLWYHTQAFKEFVEVCAPNAEEKKRLYAIVDSIKEVDC